MRYIIQHPSAGNRSRVRPSVRESVTVVCPFMWYTGIRIMKIRMKGVSLMIQKTLKKAFAAVLVAAMFCTAQAALLFAGRDYTEQKQNASAASAASDTDDDIEQEAPAVIGAVLPDTGIGASLNPDDAGAARTDNDPTGQNKVMSDAAAVGSTADAQEKHTVNTWQELRSLTAKTAAGKRAYILIGADIRSTDGKCIEIPRDRDITIDLNGHTIHHGRTSADSAGHIFWNRGRLTVTDTTAEHRGTLSGGYAHNGGAINAEEYSTTVLDHICLIGNKALDRGGAVQNYGDMTITDCFFEQCSAANGGAVCNSVTQKNSNPTMTVRNCTFSECTASISGGGISNTGTLTAGECWFRHCKATNSQNSADISTYARGGAICNYRQFNGTGMTFLYCTSNCEGGAVWFGAENNLKANGILSDCLFSDCESVSQANDGGAVCAKENTELVIRDSLFTDCRARSGAGIWSKSRLTVVNSLISGCDASQSGGGIVSYRTGDFTNVTITECTAKTGAAGMHSSKNGDPSPSNKLTACSVTKCTGSKDGSAGYGGFYNEGDLRMKDVYISECIGYSGGAVWSRGRLDFSNVFIENCKATYGGGISNHSEMTADKLTIKNCTGIQNGGGIHIRPLDGETSSNASVLSGRNLLISGNSSGTVGGGIYADTVNSITISGYNAIENNKAKTDGGGIYLNGGTLSVSGGYISGNEASGGGAGIWSSGTAAVSGLTVSKNVNAVNGGGLTNHGSMTVTDCTITGNTVSNNGGGIYLGENLGKSSSLLKINGKTTISGNSAKAGGGVYHAYEYPGAVEMQGHIVISGNLTHDVALSTGKVITITGMLEEGSWIGICPGGINVKILKDYGLYNYTAPDQFFYVTDVSEQVHISNVMDFNDVSVSDRADEQVNYRAEIWFTDRLAASYTNVSDAFERAFSEAKKRGMENKVTVKLLTDYTAPGGDFPASFSENGAIKIEGCNFEIDLNGHILSRGLNQERTYGQLFTVCTGAILTICDSDPNASHYGNSIRGGILTGGYSDKTAGCIEVQNGAQVFMNGGAIVGCHSDKAGGAIRLADGGTLNVTGGGFYYNRETNGGGAAIYGCDASITLNRAVFEGNYTTKKGGAVWIEDCILNARDCYFSADKGEDHGGALYITGDDAKADLDGCVFTGCSSGEDGGSIYVNDGEHTFISNCIFTNSYADDTGGAIHVDHDNVVLNSVSITGCTANKGGAVFVYAHRDVAVQGRVIIRGNHNKSGKDDNVALEWRTVTIKAYINNGGLYEGSEIHVHSDTSGTTRVAKNISKVQQQYFVADNGSTSLENLTSKKELFISSVIGDGNIVVILTGMMSMILVLPGIVLYRKIKAKKQADEKEV